MPHGRPRTDTQPPRRQYGSTPVPGQARSSQRPTGPFVRSIGGHLAWRPPDRSCHTDSNPLATGYCTSTDSITLSDGIGQEERAPSRRYGASDAWSALPSVPYPNGHYALCRRFRLGVFMVTRVGKLCGPNWRFSVPVPPFDRRRRRYRRGCIWEGGARSVLTWGRTSSRARAAEVRCCRGCLLSWFPGAGFCAAPSRSRVAGPGSGHAVASGTDR